MRNLFLAVSLLVCSALTSAFAQSTLPSPPFTQCPAVGHDTGCAILLVIDTFGSLRVATDPSQGPYDGIEDTLIGVQNNSSNTVASIPLKGASAIFGFDGDGICGTDPYTGLPFRPAPAGCPFGPTTYEGPGVSFSSVSSDLTSGNVNFAGGIPPGGSAYFSLEGAIQTQYTPLNVGLLKQFAAPWATDTYDHIYQTRNFANATSTAVSSTGSMELATFTTGTSQGATGSAAPLLAVAVSVAALATSHPALADSGEQTSAPAGTGKTQSNEYARGCENIWMPPPPGVSPPAGSRETQPPAQEQWKPYANAKFGYHFLYPSSAGLDARDPAHVLVLITEPSPNGTLSGSCALLSFEVIVRAVPSGSSPREMASQYYGEDEENVREEGPARLAGQPGYRMATWGGDSNINHFFTVRRSLLFEVQYEVPDTMGGLPPQGQARAAEKFRRMRDSLVIN